MQDTVDRIFRKLHQWEVRSYEETCEPSHTEQYNGFTIEIRFSCQCHEVDDPVCGDKFFIITDDGRIYANSYVYFREHKALNDAYAAIDNGEVPDVGEFDGDDYTLRR